MKKDVFSISKPLLIKALIISFVLLAVAFTTGIVIGKSDKTLLDRTSADSGDVQEQLSNCSYKLQEITAKHLDLVKIAKNKGLVDDHGKYEPNVICTINNESPDEIITDADKIVPDEDIVPEKVIVKKAVEKEVVEKEAVDSKDVEKKEVEKLKEKVLVPVAEQKCLFSIQLFSGTSKDQALAAQKKYKISKTRLVEGIVKEKSWYRIRYGCFSTRAEAENFLPEIKNDIQGAIVVAE